MNRVLLIAYHYPPEGGSSGVLRTLKFSKYLPQHGWQPHVLTLRASEYAARDEGLLQEIPVEVRVHRTRGFDVSRRLAIRGRYPAMLAVPDRHVGWLPFAIARGLGIVRREGIQALYSTSPVPTAHLIGRVLRAATHLPWVADFRDPWIEEGIFPRSGSLRYRIERRLEEGVVWNASRITVTTPELGAEIRSRYPALPENRIRVIYNGYDEQDFAGLRGSGPAGLFEIVHAGLVTPEFRDPSPVLRALARAMTEGTIERSSVRVTFLGGGSWTRSPDFLARIRSAGLVDVVQIEDRVSHQEALRRQCGAAVLLLLQASDDTRHLIPAKAFEYLRLGRPVLGIALEGATAGLLRDMGGCRVHGPDDGPGLLRSLIDLYDAWRSGQSEKARERPLARYERSHLAGELAAVLDELREPVASRALEGVTRA